MRTRFVELFAGRYETAKILLAALVVIVLRSPKLLIVGRVYAEEGTVYLQDAWNFPFLHALLAAHQGYYSLLDNVAAAAAADVFPLTWAAVLFTFTALLVLLLLVYVVITCELFESTEARLLAALLCVISPSIEVWLTLEDGQFCLAAAVAMVLLSDPRRHRMARWLTLVVGGLTGPVSCAFAPFFWVRAVMRRSWATAGQAALLTMCAGVEGLCVLNALRHGERAVAPVSKLVWIGPVFLMKVVTLTFGTRLSFFLFLNLLLHHASAAVFAVCWGLALAGMAALVYVAMSAGAAERWLLALAAWSFLFAYLGVAEPMDVLLGGASRYFFVADLLVWLMLLAAWLRTRRRSTTKRMRWLGAVVVLLVVEGSMDSVGYWSKDQLIGTPWAPQIAAWRDDPSRPIAVSPKTWGAVVRLAPRDGAKERSVDGKR